VSVAATLAAVNAGVTRARFLFLGTGTSGGVPLIACDCRTCTSADPRDRRLRTGAAVQWIDPSGKPRCVLIDATPDLRAQALRHDLWRCDAIVFTHNHVDHIFGLDEVRRFNAVMREPLMIYAEAYVLDSLRRVYRHVFDPSANVNDSFVATIIANEVPAPPEDARTPPRAIDLWGMSFTPIRLMHGRLPILGWVIAPTGSGERGAQGSGAVSAAGETGFLPLAYCTDVSTIPPSTWPWLDGLGTLVLDALRHRKHPTHLSLDQALDVAHEVEAKRTWLIHIAHEMTHGPTEALLPDGVKLAYDGLVLGSLGEEGERAFAEDKERMARVLRQRDKGPHRGQPANAEEAPATAAGRSPLDEV